TLKLHKQLEQKLLSWEKHVLSWSSQQNIPVKVVRYEDLLHFPEITFTSIVEYFELDYGKSQILSAIQNSSFSELKKQEETYGFIEKSPQAKSFFRKGMAGLGKDELGAELSNKIIASNERVMRQFGYL
ncbi:MAG TPA: sulfotransferase domain-containing protein, partial [Bacteroidales bacterium]